MPETTLPSRTVFERGLRHLPGRQMCLWEVVSEPQVGTSSRISKTEGVFIKINSMTNPFVERSRVKVNEDSSVTSLNLSVLRLTADTSPAQWAVPATLRVHTWGAMGGRGLWLQWASRGSDGVEEGSLVGGSCRQAALGASSRLCWDKQESELERRGYAGTAGRDPQVRTLGTSL